MGYDNAKIYQLVCEDGHYYYGSTINELRVRLGGHKKASLTQPYRVYKHINCVGWETVKIVLVECFPCENRQELNKKENEYISANKSDPMCLNNNLAFLTEEERLEKKRTHGAQNKAKLAEYHKKKRTGNPEVAEYQRQYRKRNEESIKESKKKYYAEHKEEDNQRCLERYYANREEILRRKREKYNERKNSNRTDQT